MTLKVPFALLAMFLVLGFFSSGSLRAAQDERKALTDRAKVLWDARVKGDWGTAYDFLADSEKKGAHQGAIHCFH